MSARSIAVACGALALIATGMSAAVAAEPQVVVSANAADVTPTLEPDAEIARPKTYAIEQAGGTIFVGGSFNAVKQQNGKVLRRHSLASFDAESAVVSALNADVDGTVLALETLGSALYVGGSFATVNGAPRRGLARVDPTTGAVDPAFNARLGAGKVTEIKAVNGRLLVGGTFSQGLVALDPTTGADTGYVDAPFEGTVSTSDAVATGVYRFAVNGDGTRLVAVGNFSTVAGQSRRRAVILRLQTDRVVVDPWYYRPLNRRCASNNEAKQPYLTDVDFSGDGTWFVLVATGFVPRYDTQIGTSVCDAAARFELGNKDPSAPTWINYTGGDTLYSVEVTPAAVYVQGHNRWLNNPQGLDSAGPGAVPRRGIGAIDTATGMALGWNPDKPARQGGHGFLATRAGLWVGSDSPKVGSEYHRGLAFFPSP